MAKLVETEFTQALQSILPWAKRRAGNLGLDPDEGETAIGDVAMRLLKRPPGPDEIRDLRKYLTGCVGNALIDVIRVRARTREKLADFAENSQAHQTRRRGNPIEIEKTDASLLLAKVRTELAHVDSPAKRRMGEMVLALSLADLADHKAIYARYAKEQKIKFATAKNSHFGRGIGVLRRAISRVLFRDFRHEAVCEFHEVIRTLRITSTRSSKEAFVLLNRN